MNNPSNISAGNNRAENKAGSVPEIEAKLDDLIYLLRYTDLDTDKIKQIKQRFNQAIDNKGRLIEQPLQAFQQLRVDDEVSRSELLDEFSVLLSGHEVNSRMSRQYIRGERFSKMVLLLIGVVMVGLGLAMIIMPAPPYFEMFTIYYFTADDGITLMDLISLIIILVGVFLIVRSFYKKSSSAV